MSRGFRVGIDDDRHPARVYITLLGLLSVGFSVATLAYWFLTGQVQALMLVASSASLALGAIGRRWSPPAHYDPFEGVQEVVKESNFCTDCGKPFASRQRQVGFDPYTGKPRFDGTRGCPDGDPMAMGSMASFLRGPWPNCGKRSSTPYRAIPHNHPIGETHVSCPPCIDQMVIDGVVDAGQAEKLYAAIGIGV